MATLVSTDAVPQHSSTAGPKQW